MYSVAITTYNRPEKTIRAIESVITKSEVNDIVVVDDASDIDNLSKLGNLIIDNFESGEKVNLIINEQNIGMSRNKSRAISLCRNQKVLILDSDNYLVPPVKNSVTPGFFEAAAKFEHLIKRHTILMPDRALPQFDYTKFAGRLIDRYNIHEFIDDNNFHVALNTCNYIVERDFYNSVYEFNPDIKETDTLWFNYLWLKAGYSLMIVPGMSYIHEVHEGSGWLQNADYNIKKGNEIITLIKNL